jgi:TonB family protein
MRSRAESRRKWATILVVAVLLHLAVLLVVRPSFFSGLLRDPETPSAGTPASGGASAPDAIVAIQIDVEDTWRPIDVTPIPAPPAEAPTPPEPANETEAESGAGNALDQLESLDLGDPAARTSGSGGGGTGRTIPPRPVEITWPETSRLKPCIGRHVEVNIQVDATGAVLRVDPVDAGAPGECLRAALAAAGKMRFVPGTVDGRPTTLWTRVRIDFEKRK